LEKKNMIPCQDNAWQQPCSPLLLDKKPDDSTALASEGVASSPPLPPDKQPLPPPLVVPEDDYRWMALL
jgi:hypothetical protein